MRQIFLSHFRNVLKNWFPTLLLSVFCLLVFGIVIGLLGSSTNTITRTYSYYTQFAKWDFEVSDFTNNLLFGTDKKLYDHFFNNSGAMFHHTKDINVRSNTENNKDIHNLEDLVQFMNGLSHESWTKEEIDLNNRNDLIQTIISAFKSGYQKYQHTLANDYVIDLYDYYDDVSENETSFYTTVGEILRDDNSQKQLFEQITKYSFLSENLYYDDYFTAHPGIKWTTNVELNYQFQNTNFRISQFENQQLNRVILTGNKSRLPNQPNEILINQKYAELKHIHLGDKITINNFQNKPDGKPLLHQFTVVGFGLKLDDLFNQGQGWLSTNQNTNPQAIIYMPNSEFWREFEVANPLGQATEKQYFAFQSASIKQDFFKNGYLWHHIPNNYTWNPPIPYDKFVSFQDNNFNQNFFKLLLEWFVFLIIGVFLILITILFLNLNIKKEIHANRHLLGIYKASGFQPWQLILPYTVHNFILLVVCAGLGYLISLPLQIQVTNILFSNVNITQDAINNIWWFIMIMIIFIPAVFGLISGVIATRLLKCPVMNLIYSNEITKPIRWHFTTNNVVFKYFLINLRTDKWKLLFIYILYLLTILILILQINMNSLISEIKTPQYFFYNTQVDHSFSFAPFKKMDYLGGDTNKFVYNNEVIDTVNFPEVNYLNYQQKVYQPQAANIQKFHQLVNSYLQINRSGDYSIALLEWFYNHKSELNEAVMNQPHQEYKALQWADVFAFFNAVLKDNRVYHFFDNLNVNLQELMNLNQKIANPQALISFNKYYLNTNHELGLLALDTKLVVNSVPTPYTTTIYLSTTPHLNGYLNFHGAENQTVNKLFADSTTMLPIMISQRIFANSELKIGDEMKLQFLKQELPCKIIGVQSSNVYNYAIYGSYNTFNKLAHLTNYLSETTFNTILGTNNILNSDLKSVQPIYSLYWPNKNTYSLLDVIQNFKQVTIMNNLNGDFISLPLVNHFIQQGFTRFIPILQYLGVSLIILCLIVLFVLIMIAVETKAKVTQLLNRIGYPRFKIYFMNISHYLTTIIAAVITSEILAYVLTKLTANHLAHSTIFYLAFTPHIAQYWIIILLIILIISLLICAIYYGAIRRNPLNTKL